MLPLLLAAVLGASPKAEAQALARRSIIEYNAGDFEKALLDAQQAYELEPLAGLLYNLGQCHRALHHWERAEFFYRGYLREKPGAKNRPEVERLIAEMKQHEQDELAERRAAQAPPTIVLPTAPPVAAVPPPASSQPSPATAPLAPAPAAALAAPIPSRGASGAA
ncbi:MAG: hypothetical protein ACYCWW_05650, partial [Deltaproteobacteria bacterium]